MLENIIFKKIELWIVLLIIITAIITTILFGWSVRHYQKGGQKLGRLGPIIDSIATFPTVAKKSLSFFAQKEDLVADDEQRFNGESGFHFNYAAGGRPDLGYVLVNRYDGDLESSVSELWDLNSQKKVHEWSFAGVDAVWETSNLQSNIIDFRIDSASKRFRNVHTLLEENGKLLSQAHTPLISANTCSSIAIFQDSALYHHSIERDHDGNFWSPQTMEPKTVNIGSEDFLDDGIAQISPSGAVLFEKSVIQLLDENGLGYLIYGKGNANDDPIHLNEINPVLKDGRFWKRGDLFLSLRHQSMIVLYRPSTNQVIWHQQGPWIHQHDVEILNDHEISIFNNNAALRRSSDWSVRGTNDLVIYDFETHTTRSPFRAGFINNDIRTKTEGRGQIIGNEAFVEESNYGRLIQFSPEGKISWQFINRAKDGRVYLLNWSRIISRESGDKIRSTITQKHCP